MTDSEKNALETKNIFRVGITPYFASLINADNPDCPIRKQVIPTKKETEPFSFMMADSLAEDNQSPVKRLVHSYPDRVLMLVTTQCASYCRYCTRSRIVGNPKKNFESQIEYIKRNIQIRDVLLSGGDLLLLSLKQLDFILSSLQAIPHVEIIRMSSRVPVFLPMRITSQLCDILAKYHPFWMNIHVNHPIHSAYDKYLKILRMGIVFHQTNS